MRLKKNIIKLLISTMTLLLILGGVISYLTVVEERLSLQQAQTNKTNIKNIYYGNNFVGASKNSDLHSWERENLQAVYNMYLRVGNGIELKTQIPREEAINPKPARVLVVGDSFVWGHGLLDEQRRYPELLELELNNRVGHADFEVSSIARFGGSTIEESQWITSELLRKFQPDIIVVGYVLNDIIPSGKELALCGSNVEMCAKGFIPSKEYLKCLRGEGGFVDKLINNSLSGKFPNLANNLMVKRCTPGWAKGLDENKLIDNPEESPYWLEFTESVALIKDTVGEIPIIWAPTNHTGSEKALMPIKEVFKKNGFIIAPMSKGKDTVEKYLKEVRSEDFIAGKLNLTRAHASPVDPHPGSALNYAFAQDLAEVVLQHLPKRNGGEVDISSQLVISTNPANIKYEQIDKNQEILSYVEKDVNTPIYKTTTQQYPAQYVPCLRVGKPYLQINFDQRVKKGSKIIIENIGKTPYLKIQGFGYSSSGEEVYGSISEFNEVSLIEVMDSVSGFLLIDTKNGCGLQNEINFPNVKIKVTKN